MPTLEWIGKEKVINHHQDVPYRVLDKKYTYNGDTSENMIIHGDNLLALKSLLPKYEGRIDCIYIDPPYNTGNENWVYDDNVNDPHIKKWLGDVVGQEGEDLSRHDKWLCMIYPRLKLLQKLLKPNGIILVSIDDNEIAYLRLVLDEIFGRSNFIANCIVKRSTNGMGDKKGFSNNADYVLCYQNSDEAIFYGLAPDADYIATFEHEDEFGKYKMDGILMKKGAGSLRTDVPTLFFPLYYSPISGEVSLEKKDGYIERFPIKSNGVEGRWTWSKGKIQNEAYRLYASNNGTIYIKDYLTDDRRQKPKTILDNKNYLTNIATNEIKKIFDEKAFDTPKPLSFIKDLLENCCQADGIVLDSFAGSGTTAHAVLELNKKDGGNRKFILVEMMDYAESITAERVKRVIKGYGDGNKTVEGTDGDFSYYELGLPLFDESHNLNEEVGIKEIHKYVYYMETKEAISENKTDNEYFLGQHNGTAYYFYYDRENITTLNREFLSSIQSKATDYVIYADVCALPKEVLKEHGITFKKIPRDISRL